MTAQRKREYRILCGATACIALAMALRILSRVLPGSHPAVKIVVVTSLVDSTVLAGAKEAGADSLWYKDAAEETLMNVVRATMRGEHIFPDAPPDVDIGTAKSREFTRAARKVLRYLVRGLSYGRIAEEMGVEITTVKYHVTNMLQKTNLENKLQLALAVSSAKFIADLAEDE